ncbi:MAG TPA: hypothetical protein DHV31_03160 [Clostridiales bacterium]|nr:hypothetical protein [Clostridiales bacterium]
MFIGDYHTHTKFSDGKGSVLDNALAAKRMGLREMAVTDHGFRILTMSFKKYLRAKRCCREAESQTGVKIYAGVEADIVSLKGDVDIREDHIEPIEYIIAGFHKFAFPRSIGDFFKMYFVTYFNGLIRPSKKAVARNTRAVVSAINRYPIKALTHLNHSLKVNVGEVAKACAEKGVLVEINAKHLRDFKGVWGDLAASNARFVVNSDAHRPNEVGRVQQAFDEAVKQGIDPKRIVNYCGE